LSNGLPDFAQELLQHFKALALPVAVVVLGPDEGSLLLVCEGHPQVFRHEMALVIGQLKRCGVFSISSYFTTSNVSVSSVSVLKICYFSIASGSVLEKRFKNYNTTAGHLVIINA